MFKGLETSKKLLKLVDEYVSSEEEEGEESKDGKDLASQPQEFEERKTAELTQLPEGYDLVEEVKDE